MSKPVINFVHANGFPAGSYRTFLSLFSNDYSTIALEQYGHDDNYPIHNNWQFLVNELVDFVKKQEQKVICIGHSFGGVISFMAACQHPELFRGVVMLDPPVFSGPLSWFLKVAKKTPFIDKISPAGRAKNRQKHWPSETKLVNNFANKKLFRHFDPRCLQDYVNSAVTLKNKRWELMFSPDVEADIFRHLPCNLTTFKNKLTVPSALIYGEKTDVLPVSYFNRFAKMNDIPLTQIANGGHMFPLEQPEKTAAIINNIIQDW
ncbi:MULTISPECIES: alpha/beta fold hydrolase [unclassified Colwellia]|uniref:alpha/beta fold hydrolase n=1 Tax=unclassified Colwellia TaxID=196834 RepID=UPI0015F5390C|nr:MULTISPECIES: alpha/beta hydrolase [unclassified Colwellia]MBA6233847.1 alpha/beta hydrolase [Colwellia sp. MB02u-7]MBA6237337.1 alpha/beta hydrolase [Colwellia sp. MB02u-11]MBA6256412.1 alpha/beta hydrolase [Colwellia sp. MB3u-28]MBA6260386.1 alpha/beta hydrolase [Colwellia sp. MB3u-41]MBA6300337.1 alpha/beta hydrolase [Colwellia sp. MB3u-22]